MKRACPNCNGGVGERHARNDCVLGALMQVIRERGNKSAKELCDLHANADVDSLWERLGPIIDDLEDGVFS